MKKTLEVVETGHSAFDDTPDKTKGITWAVVKTPAGKVFGTCNVHFWWKYGSEEYDVLRMKNARQLCGIMASIREKYGCPVFGLGDMNCVLDYPVFKTVYQENGVQSMLPLTENRDMTCSIRDFPEADGDGSYHGKKSDRDHTASIDHIVGLGTEFSVAQYRVAEDRFALDASDHCPVYTDVEL